MRKIIFLLLIFDLVGFNLKSQPVHNLNGYKYLYIEPLKYSNGQDDIYGLGQITSDLFRSKGFVILRYEDFEHSTIEFNNARCEILFCFLAHTGNLSGKNEVRVILKNCRDQIVYDNLGKANTFGGTLQDDLKRGIRKALEPIEDWHYNFDSTLTPQIEYPTVDKIDITEDELKKYFDNNKLGLLEGIYKSFQNDNLGYYKIAIKKVENKYVAIVLESANRIWKQGEIKAYFEPTSAEGVYSVKWYMGDKSNVETFAEMKNNTILSIVFNKPDGSKTESEFIKIYPSVDNDYNSNKSTSVIYSGTGFFLTTNGLIATNAHVIEDAKKIQIRLNTDLGNFTYNAKVELKDTKNDVAIIKIDDDKFKDLNFIPYSLDGKAEIGEKCFTIGFPLDNVMGTNFKLTDGIISSNSGVEDDVRYYQITVPIQPGNSGGALFNSDGNIIGVTSAKLNSEAVGTIVENVNYAIKIQYLDNILNMLPDYVPPKPDSQYLKGKDLIEQVKVLKNFVCLIEVTH